MKAKCLFLVLVAVLLMGIGYNALAVTGKDGEQSGVLSTGIEDQTGVAVSALHVNPGL
jgi:hypothetical protein